jgi:CRP/FNR family transcriptional regulator, cyclic AMP receptor protein
LGTVSDRGSLRARRPEPPSQAVRVLEADPDLSAGIEERELSLAVMASIAPMFEFERGAWHFSPPPDTGGFGALVLEGLMVIRINADTRGHVELVGPGDLISPWVGFGPDMTLPSVVTALVVSKARVSLLDRRFALRTSRWPEIHAALIQRVIVRTRRLSLQSAINSLPRVEERLEVTLWELAYRFGRVTPEGTVLDLPLTHSQLAEMVAAQRPSVSTALARLQNHGRVMHTARHRWLLCGDPPSTLSSLAQQTGLEA